MASLLARLYQELFRFRNGFRYHGGMTEMWLTADEAAQRLGVSSRRVRALVSAGRLAGRHAGRTLLVSPDSVGRLQVVRARGGRAAAAMTVWAVLLSDLTTRDWPVVAAAFAISPQRRYQLRTWLRQHDAEDWAWLGRNRATEHRLRSRPAYLEEIMSRDDVVPGGVSAAAVHELDLVATGVAELYTSGVGLARLVDEYRLREDPAGNLVIRTPRTQEERHEDFILDRPVMPAAVVAADLLESGEARSMRTGRRVLDRLLARLTRPDAATRT